MLRTRSMTTGVSRRRQGLAVLSATALATASIGLVAPAATAQGSLSVDVGVGLSTEAGNAFLPGDVTVGVGDSISFVIGSDQPHTVTIGDGPADVPPFGWPVSGFDEAGESGLGTASTDGSEFVNTGLMFGVGNAAAVEFTAPGQVLVFCTIHPGMEMNVTVVEDGATTTQEEADAAAEASREVIVNAFDPLREGRRADVTSSENEDGATTWSIFADAATATEALPGGGTGYAELLEFIPDVIEVSAGDTVTWTADRVHTVTFVPEGARFREEYPNANAAFMPTGGPTYDGSEAVNSGFFNTPGPDGNALTEFSVTFPEPGEYNYFCAIHFELSHTGTVIVS